MATVHLGRLLGPVGFGRTVAVKRLHSQFASDQDFVTMFLDEAHIVARIRHPNVVPMVDVIESNEGLFLVMEYVHGESYSKLLRASRTRKLPVPLKIVTAIMQGLLLGLHAAHETKGATGELLDVVHRDVSPQNVIVGADGVARVLDFGVAKAAGRAQVTREGQIKGKLAYMAPEQIRGVVDRRSDVFAAAVVLWESLAGRRLHEGAKDVEIVTRVVEGGFPPPSKFRPDIPPELDAIVMKGLETDPDQRYQNAREMAIDLEKRIGLASPTEIAEWVEQLASEVLATRARMVSAMEAASAKLAPKDSQPPPAGADDDERPTIRAPEGGDIDIVLDDGKKLQSGKLPAFQTGEALPPGAHPLPAAGAPPPSAHDLPLMRPSVQIPTEVSSRTAATPMNTEMPVRQPPPQQQQEQRDLAPMIALLSFCGMLAVVGIVLVVLSLMARRPGGASPTFPPPAISASAIPSAKAVAPPGAIAPVEKQPASTPSAKPSAARVPGAVPSAPTVRGAGARPEAPAAPAGAKKDCDPPFVMDEQGHKHYKMECMTQD
jgi:serine/threonine-protein kinase